MSRIINVEFNLSEYKKSVDSQNIVGPETTDAQIISIMMFELAGVLVKMAGGVNNTASPNEMQLLHSKGYVSKRDVFNNIFNVATVTLDNNTPDVMDMFKKPVPPPPPKDEIIDTGHGALAGHKLF